MMRRTFLSSLAALSVAAAPRSRFGVATTCFMGFRRPKDTIEFLEYANTLGAAGIQASLASLEPAYLDRLERRAKDLGMYIEIMSRLPQLDMSNFVQTVEAAKRVGALCIRSACLSGRRYETFSTLDEWNTFVSRSKDAIARAVPIAEKNKLPLALENHKDWTLDELLSIMKSYESRYLGVCLDTGNNIALLDHPMEFVERLAPYAVSTHIKDMGVAESATGFLLSEMPIGEGMLDMPRIISTITAARPETKLTLEMITRDPLQVPVLTDKYWVTFPERSGILLARMLRTVKERRRELPRVSNLSRDAQLRVEEDNVRRCLNRPV